MRVTLRWIRADLRSRRVQALLAVQVIAGVVVTLIVGITLLEGTLNPWRGVFARSRGAHVWVHTTPGTDLRPLARLDGVTAIAGPYQTAAATVVRNGRRARMELRAVGPELPEVARPLVAEGRWLTPGAQDAVVLERSFARSLDVAAGGSVTTQALDGTTHRFLVIGIADSADQIPYPESGQGLAWALPPTLAAVQPANDKTRQLVGLRLADPEMTDFVAQRAATAIPESQMQSMSTWREVRARMELDDRLLGSFLALFGVVGLAASALAIANTTGGWVLGRLRDIALLKTLGLTPNQVMRMLLLEQLLVGAVGIALGVLGARLLTSTELSPLWPGPLPPGTAAPLSSDRLLAIVGGTALTLLLATFLPAWRGSRVSLMTAAGVSPPGGRLSALARLALLVRCPPALVLGARDAFTRRARAALTIVGLAVPMFMVTIVLGCLATLDGFEENPERVGFTGALRVRAPGMTDQQATRLIRADPEVRETLPGGYAEALLPGQTRTVRLRVVGDSARPYPYTLAQGRLYRSPGEAVVGQGLLNTLQARVGERVRLKVGDRPFVLHIVGRTIEPEDNGEVLSVGRDTLADLPEAVSTPFIAVALRPGADPETVRGRLLDGSDRRLDVQTASSTADRLSVIRTTSPALIAVLALIGLANLLTAASVGLHDHVRDLSVLRAIGLTPRQVYTTLVTGTALLALMAVVIGAVLGVLLSSWLIDLQGHASGVGSGIGRAPGAATVLLSAAVAMVMATLTALIPGRRAARASMASTTSDRRTTFEQPIPSPDPPRLRPKTRPEPARAGPDDHP